MTNNNHTEVSVKQAAMIRSRRTVFLVDSSKLGRTALVQIARVTEPHTLVTTKKLPSGDAGGFRDLGWEVMIAD